MPFFSRRAESEEDAVPVEEPAANYEEPKRHGLFGRNREPEPVAEPEPAAAERKHGLFGRRETSPARSAVTASSASPSTAGSGLGSRRSILHRGGRGSGSVEMDPSIVAARERVMAAEGAERDADRALAAARTRVREAREEVRKLELEAQEEARRAKIKQYHAKEVSKRGSALGRHGA